MITEEIIGMTKRGTQYHVGAHTFYTFSECHGFQWLMDTVFWSGMNIDYLIYIYLHLHLYGEVTSGKIAHGWTFCVKPHNTVLLGPFARPSLSGSSGGDQHVWLRKLGWLPASCALIKVHVRISEHGTSVMLPVFSRCLIKKGSASPTCTRRGN